MRRAKPTRSQPRYRPGDKIGGRYQVHQALMGGMGEVYLCLDLETIQPYALKTFQQRYLTNPKLRAAFENEVATWVALEKHPNIVRCFYMDILDNQPFMFLEWIASDESRGTDLRSWLRRGPLDLRLALDFTIDICRGLIHAQEKQPGIVHCDLKPENILVAQGRLAKITDFGLAKIVQEAELEITTDAEHETYRRQSLLGLGGIVGTPPYMAPEQWRGEALDGRTDIYAVGCILYEMLTGRWPFQATTIEDFRCQHLEGDIPRLANDQTLPSPLDTLLVSCMAKQREERFNSVDTLLKELSLIYEWQFAETPRDVEVSEELSAIEYNNRGVTYLHLQHHYDKALEDYSRAIQLDPTFVYAYINRGTTYSKLQCYDEALADHNRAIELAPTFAPAYLGRGTSYLELQRYDEALTDYDRAIELDPTSPVAYCNRGITYEGLQQYDKALADYSSAIEVDSTYATAYNNRGGLYLGLERYKEAFMDCTRAIELDPIFVPAHVNLGNIYDGLQRYDEALASHSRAIDLDPNCVKAYYNRGKTNYCLQRYAEALADFSRAVELDPNYAMAYTNRGATYVKLQREYDALIDHLRAVELDPSLSHAYYNIGSLLAGFGALRKALSCLEKASRLGNIGAAQYLAEIRKTLGQIDPVQLAVEAYMDASSPEDMRRVVETFPFMADTHFISVMEQGESSRDFAPQSSQRFVWLRQIAVEQEIDRLSTDYLDRQRKGQAINVGDLLQQLALIYPPELDLPLIARTLPFGELSAKEYHDRGLVYVNSKQYDKALADFNRAIQLDPTLVLPYVSRAMVYKELQQYNKALADCDHAIQLDPACVAAYNNRGIIHYDLQRYEEALADYTKAIQLGPTAVEPYNCRGNAYVALRRYKEAIADYTKAIQLDPRYAIAYYSRGNTYADLQQYEDALADYFRAIRLDPSLAQAYTSIGVTFGNSGKLREALDYFEKAAQLGDPHAAHNLVIAKERLGFQAFQEASSFDEMRLAVAEFPFMVDADFIAAIERAIAQQVPPVYRPAFEERLTGLRQIAYEQKREEQSQ